MANPRVRGMAFDSQGAQPNAHPAPVYLADLQALLC